MPEHPDPKIKPHPWAEFYREPMLRAMHGGQDEPRERARRMSSSVGYAELHVTSNYTFLTGASHPDELIEQAAKLGHAAIAITDVNTVAGIVRAHVAAKEVGIQLIVGCHLVLQCGHADADGQGGALGQLSVLVYPTDRASYGRLCRLLSIGKRRAPKGECYLTLHDLLEHQEGLLAVVVPPRSLDQRVVEIITGMRRVFDDDRLSIAASHLYTDDAASRLAMLAGLADHTGAGLVATNDVHYHIPQRKALQDVLTCIRHGCTIEQAGLRLFPNAERYLKSPEEMARLFGEYPQAIRRTIAIAERAAGFSLDQLRYQYPDEVVPPGKTPMQHLIDLTWRGAGERYPRGVPEKVRRQIEHELRLIDELNYAQYFLTVHDLVIFARGRGILCQGRGAAANSAVCYCLGVTSVDPDRINLLVERFISKERNEPPDIDIDFEHERREEVIQYIYHEYGRDRAALTAEVITYRGRSAVREVGKVMGLSLDLVDRLAKDIDWWSDQATRVERIAAMGLDPNEPTIRRVVQLSGEILGFPRHLSQHVGGFVITQGPLCEMVPVENAAMPDRTVIEWDKDDIDAVGMLKVDCLGLGMLTCIRKGFDLLEEVTKLRSDEVTKCFDRKGEISDQDISRSYSVAEGNGAGGTGLSRDCADAAGGAIRTDNSDATICCVDSVKYRQGLRSPEQCRLSEVSSDIERVIERDGHAIRTCDPSEDVAREQCDDGKDWRSGSDSPGIDQQHQEAARLTSVCRSCHARLSLADVPAEDPAVYDMICEADTIGVFQIESRAQMTMLPRLRPRCFYDLVIEVAIVRPGPIQGDMVHPYLRRRNGEEPVEYPSEEVRAVLGKTLGVPLFQEQAMSLAIVAAGFTPGEADKLRRAMAAWKRRGDQLASFEGKFINGMLERGYRREFAERCFRQLRGFSEYGFPESHAASFALLVYVSAWLKKHYPAVFAAALLNSQPMGFYAPAQIVRDAQDHGVQVRGVDVNHSAWDCTLERIDEVREVGRCDGDVCQLPQYCELLALRLGMRMVKGMRADDAERIVEAVKAHGRFESIAGLKRASGVSIATLRRLAAADAFGSMGLDRQAALWHIRALRDETLPMFDDLLSGEDREEVTLPPLAPSRHVIDDYKWVGLSLKNHPVSFLRELLDGRYVTRNGELGDEGRCPQNKRISVAGLVLVRQRPATASGLIFMTIEDETGIANLIVRPQVYERYRRAARHSTIILARGYVERQGKVVHVVVSSIHSLDEHLQDLLSASRDFH